MMNTCIHCRDEHEKMISRLKFRMTGKVGNTTLPDILQDLGFLAVIGESHLQANLMRQR